MISKYITIGTFNKAKIIVHVINYRLCLFDAKIYKKVYYYKKYTFRFL